MLRGGIYALYDKKGRLYYAGKASDLPRRLNQHLKDRHRDSWDRMTLFLVGDSANVAALEGLLIATAKPPGNKWFVATLRTLEYYTGLDLHHGTSPVLADK
jgi:excinuclease UvrABC nuclease subunit